MKIGSEEKPGYWRQMADKRLGNLPQGNQECLMIRDNVGRPPGELGVSTWNMIIRLDALALSVIAAATWLAGWLGGCHTPVLYQNG